MSRQDVKVKSELESQYEIGLTELLENHRERGEGADKGPERTTCVEVRGKGAHWSP